MYEHEIITRCLAPWGDVKSAKNFEMTYLFSKLCVWNVQKHSNSSFLSDPQNFRSILIASGEGSTTHLKVEKFVLKINMIFCKYYQNPLGQLSK